MILIDSKDIHSMETFKNNKMKLYQNINNTIEVLCDKNNGILKESAMESFKSNNWNSTKEFTIKSVDLTKRGEILFSRCVESITDALLTGCTMSLRTSIEDVKTREIAAMPVPEFITTESYFEQAKNISKILNKHDAEFETAINEVWKKVSDDDTDDVW